MTETKPSRGGRPVGTVAAKSDAVKQTRQALNLSQQFMATHIGCSVSAVQRMERLGTLPQNTALLESFKRLAKRAGVSLETKAEEVAA
jgi:ribosome-binding protein aMBF1 (putative translation factor)